MILDENPDLYQKNHTFDHIAFPDRLFRGSLFKTVSPVQEG